MRCTVQHSLRVVRCQRLQIDNLFKSDYAKNRTTPEASFRSRKQVAIAGVGCFLAPLHIKDMQPCEVQSATSTIIDLRKKTRFMIII